MVNSIDGTLMDKFQFNKPANWAPSLKAKQTFASNFMGNYTVNAIEEEIYGEHDA